MPHVITPIEERLWYRVDKNGPIPADKPELGPCWIWKGEVDGKGFGIIYTYAPNRRRLAVHHVVYELLVGELAKDARVDQTCGMRSCCNPAHLIRLTTEDRFWAKVDKYGPVPESNPSLGPCWLWLGSIDVGGYGAFRVEVGASMAKPHRFSFELVNGPIPDGLELDHICHDPKICTLGKLCPHRRCVNPAHVKPVTKKENCSPERSGASAVKIAQAKLITHCKRGHEYTPENTYRRGNKRGCFACRRERYRNFQGELNPETAAKWEARTHCRHGHELTPGNTYINNGCKTCRACGREATGKYLARKKHRE